MFDEICEELGISVEFIMADDNWVSNQFASDFLEVLKRKTGDKLIAEKAGRFAASPEVLNSVEHFLITNLPFPGLFFILLPHEYAKFNRFNSVKLVKARPGNYVFSMTPKNKNEKAHPDICLNTIGMLSSTEQAYGLDSLHITHTKCVHNGDENCEFVVSYTAKKFLFRKISNLFLFIATSAAATKIAMLAKNQIGYFSLALIASFFLSLFVILIKKYASLFSYLTQYYQQSHEKSDALYKSFKKLDKRYQESNLLREFSLQIQSEERILNLVELCLFELNKRFGYERGLVMLLSSDETYLYVASQIGFVDTSQLIGNLKFQYPSLKNKPQLFANILDTRKTVLISNMDDFKSQIKEENKKIVDTLGVSSMVIAPIYNGNRKFGLLALGTLKKENPLTNDDTHLIENVCRLLSIAFKNIFYLEQERNLRELFQKYVPNEVLISLDSKNILAPQNKNITSMFVDLRGFTSKSEHMTPEKIVNSLNMYTDFVSKKIAAHGGVIDKLNGDGVVSFFLHENDEKKTAQKAISAAIDILSDLEHLNKIYKSKGYAPISLGIGINSGPATVGSIGGEIKLNYTAIGNTVNVAARLEELSKNYRDATRVDTENIMLISKHTFVTASIEIEYTDLGVVQIRGKSKETEVIGINEAQAKRFILSKSKRAS